MKPSSIILPSQLETNTEAQFLRLAEKFCSNFHKFGLNTKPTRHSVPIEFRKATRTLQERAIGYLEFNLDLAQELADSGEKITDTKVFLWRALQKLRLVPPSDVLNYIKDEDIVEIYFLDEIQAFRNFRFLEMTSYTVEEMLCRPWYRNTKRSFKPQMQMIAMVLKGKLGQITKPTLWNIPEHDLWEKDTEGLHHFKIQLKHFIPLRTAARITAFVSTNFSQLI